MILARSISILRQNKLVTNAGIYVLGNMLQRALAFILLPIYAYYLTPEQMGIFGLAAAAGRVLVVILGFGLSGSVARYYYDYLPEPERQKSFISTIFFFLVIVVGGLVLIMTQWGETIWNKVTSGQVPYSPFIVVVLWGSYAAVIFQLPTTLFRAQQRAMAFLAAQISFFTLSLLLTIVLIVGLSWGAMGPLSARLISFLAIASVLSVLLLRQWFSPRISLRELRTGLSYGLPLVPHLLSAWLLVFIDRFLLESRVPLAELGIYELGYRAGLIMNVLVVSINMAWTPYYFELMTKQRAAENRVKQVFELYVAGMAPICLFGVLFSGSALELIAPARYQAAAVFIPIVLFSYLINGYSHFFAAPLTFFHKTIWLPAITVSAAILNIVLNLLWIPVAGTMGSAWATLVAYAASTVLAYVVGRRWQRVDYPVLKLVIVNGIIMVAVTLITFESPVGGSSLLTTLGRGLLLALFVVLNYVWFVRPNLSVLRLKGKDAVR